MTPDSSRRVLALLLVAATVLFAVGARIEQSKDGGENAEAPPAAAVEAAEEGEGEEAGHAESEPGVGERHAEDEEERLLGVDLESTPLIVLAVLVGLGAAAVVASALGGRRNVLLAVVALAVVWAALDVREVAHQLDESHEDIAAIAGVVAALHLLIAAQAGRLVSRA